MARELEYTKVLSDESSFQLVRTNPKLTGNIKLTVNESDMIWLNAIPANLELAKDDFSKFPVDTTHSLPSNIYQFFKRGETPNEIIFQLTEEVDTTKTSKSYKDQFDFSNYFSGVKYLPSNKYDERLSYFAPLYVKDELPNYFVIFKIKDPLNKRIDLIKDDYVSSGVGVVKADYLAELFQKATIVKTFDLRADTKIGKLIRDYRFSPNFPVAPLTVNFREDQATSWNGILINSGVLGSRGELLYPLYQSSTPLKFFEENITKGFERNGVIFPNILNLEFIFNDDESELYDFDRYVGFYVNSIDLANLKLDLERSYAERATWENTPRLRRQYYDYEEQSVAQSNPDGVLLPYKELNLNLSEFSQIFNEDNTYYFNYIQDRDDKFYLPKISVGDSAVSPYNIDISNPRQVDLTYDGTKVIATLPAHGFSTDDYVYIDSTNPDYSGEFFVTRISENQFSYIPNPATFLQTTVTGSIISEIGTGKIRLSNTKIDFGKFFGPDNNIFLQDVGFTSLGPGYSSIAVQIKSQLSHIDEFTLYHPNGTRKDNIGKYDTYTAVENYSTVQAFGSFYAFNDYDGVSGGDVFYFNGKGLVNEIATGLAGALNSTRNRTFTAYSFEDWVFIKCNTPGDFDNLHKIKYTSPTLDYTRVVLGDTEEDNLINTLITFTGGSKFAGNRLVINYNHFQKIKNNLAELLIKTEDGWSGIGKISRYFDTINESNSTSRGDRVSAISDYQQKMVITLALEKVPSIRYTNFLIKKKSRPKFGLFSFFPIKDLDFDFLSSTYLNFPKIDLYQHYYVPPGVELLESGIQYQVIGGQIEVEAIQYSDGDYFTIISSKAQYSVVSGDPIVTYAADTSSLPYSLNYPILDGNRELKDFPGFSILKDPSLVVPQQNTDIFTLRDKFINGLTSTEYDFYKENIATDFALRSKILPYINKWAIKNGKDARDNPYRLNTEIVFGRNNFCPDHTDRSQNPETFTHEWFYIESSFNYLNDINTIKENTSYFDKPLDLNLLLTDKDYFINYFTYTPKIEVGGDDFDVAQTQFRYSKLFKNRAGQYETFFGFKVQFRDVVDSTVLGEDSRPQFNTQSNRFDDYKFSCILKPVKEDFYDQSKPPIKYEIIEHKDFKFILLVIKLYIGDESSISDYWKEQTLNTTEEKLTNDLAGSGFFYADPSYTTEFGLLRPYQTILGDYRIKFNLEEVSNLTYNLIYSLKNKKFNTKLDNFSNVKLSKKIDLSQPILSNTFEELVNPQTSNYPSLFSNEVLKPNGEKFIAVRNSFLNVDYIIDTFSGVNPQNFNPINRATSNTLLYEVAAGELARLASTIASTPYTTLFSSLPLSSGLRPIIANYFQFFVIGGGEQYFERLFENLSFAKFKQYVNNYDPFIEYYSYAYDSETEQYALADDPKFYLDIDDQDQIFKVNQVIPIVDEDVPSQFSSIENLSYVYEVSRVIPPLQLNRYGGEYEPIAVDLLNCFSKFKFKKNRIEDLSLANVNLNISINSLMTIGNFNHIKVSETKILSLESDDAFLPKYPSIGEIAIGTAPYFLLNSNWDWGFHHRWLTKTQLEPVAGTLRVEEDQNFLAKILAVPAEVELEDFNIQTVPASTNLNNLNFNLFEIAIKEGNNQLEGIINLNNVLTRYFIENGIENKFNEFLVNSAQYIGTFNSIQDYVKAYISQNILELYTVDQVEFYKKSDALLTSTLPVPNVNLVSFQFLSDTERFDQGYSQIKSIEINNLDKLILRFLIRKEVGAGFYISPKVKIKFI